MPGSFKVERHPSGSLVVVFEDEPSEAEVAAAARELIGHLRGDGEHLVIHVRSETGTLDRRRGAVWSSTLAPHRHRFARTSVVGVRSALSRMIITTVALTDRQRVRFFDSVEEALRA